MVLYTECINPSPTSTKVVIIQSNIHCPHFDIGLSMNNLDIRKLVDTTYWPCGGDPLQKS